MQFSILDYNLDLLRNLIHIIDQHLEHIIEVSLQVDNADSFGYFDNAEQIIGLGFVACQTYLSSVHGYLKIDKRKALSVGSFHSSGQSKVQIINHAANYWKHNSEWVFEKNSKQKKFVEDAFELVGFPINADYPLSGVLTEVRKNNMSSILIPAPPCVSCRSFDPHPVLPPNQSSDLGEGEQKYL